MTMARGTYRDAAVHIARRLYEAGHTAYLAGGCVRDRLLGVEPKDYDVATDARPDVVKRLFCGARYVGEAFGVVLVPIRSGRRYHLVEVATFRTEWAYRDGRRPSHVEFTDAEHDATRRDFTMNGLFENPMAQTADQRIIDFVGGRIDLESGIVRAIGDPDERFAEDYLRMLRAVRFAARFQFAIEPDTTTAIRKHAAKLRQVSRERIGQEIKAMLTPGQDTQPALAVRLLQQMHLDGPVLAEDHVVPQIPVVEDLRNDVDYPTVLAAWVVDRHRLPGVPNFQGAEVIARRWRQALCLSNDQYNDLQMTLRLIAPALGWVTMAVARQKRLLSQARWSAALAILEASSSVHGTAAILDQILRESKPLFDEGVAPRPLINGGDLISAGHKPGPAFSRLLDAAYDAQLEGQVRNRQEALDWVRRHR